MSIVSSYFQKLNYFINIYEYFKIFLIDYKIKINYKKIKWERKLKCFIECPVNQAELTIFYMVLYYSKLL